MTPEQLSLAIKNGILGAFSDSVALRRLAALLLVGKDLTVGDRIKFATDLIVTLRDIELAENKQRQELENGKPPASNGKGEKKSLAKDVRRATTSGSR